jgi:hypothetical protein
MQMERLLSRADHIIMMLRSVRRTACPGCTLTGTPFQGRSANRLIVGRNNNGYGGVRLRTRRFFCDTEECAYHIFTERLSETTETFARCTLRMERALRWLELAMGGAPEHAPRKD